MFMACALSVRSRGSASLASNLAEARDFNVNAGMVQAENAQRPATLSFAECRGRVRMSFPAPNTKERVPQHVRALLAAHYGEARGAASPSSNLRTERAPAFPGL